MKLSVFLRKRSGITTGGFRDWWLDHVQLSSQIPGLSRYHINFVESTERFHVGLDEVGYDGTAELSFEMGPTLDEGFDSPIAKHAVEDADRVCSRRIEFRTEEHVIVDGPVGDPTDLLKLVVLLKRRQGLSRDAWRGWWLDHVEISRTIPGLLGYRINFVDGVQGANFKDSEVDYDGSAELWFESERALQKGFGSPIGLRAGLDAEAHCAKRVRFMTREYVVR
jgi:uncharacterized protein (TIGR02118 family)